MRGTAKAVGLSLLLMGLTEPAAAQDRTRQKSDFFGVWENLPALQQGDDPWGYSTLIYMAIDFRPDMSVLRIAVAAEGQDTMHYGNVVAPHSGPDDSFWEGDTLVWTGEYEVRAFIKDQRLTIEWPGSQAARTFKRISALPPSIAGIVAKGVGSARPIPVPRQPPTGTLEDLVGIWEKVGGPEHKPHRRQVLVFWPDSTTTAVMAYKAGMGGDRFTGMANARRWIPWSEYARQPGDSIIQGPNTRRMILHQNERLTIHAEGSDHAGIYQRIDSLPPHP